MITTTNIGGQGGAPCKEENDHVLRVLRVYVPYVNPVIRQIIHISISVFISMIHDTDTDKLKWGNHTRIISSYMFR